MISLAPFEKEKYPLWTPLKGNTGQARENLSGPGSRSLGNSIEQKREGEGIFTLMMPRLVIKAGFDIVADARK
jgi:hypothetical protein